MFWRFDSSIFPSYCVIEHQPTKCDPCHYNVTGVPDGVLNTLFKANTLADFSICGDGGPRPLALDDLIS